MSTDDPLRDLVIHASRVLLVDEGRRWPETHGELADWVLALPGITVAAGSPQ